MQNEKDFLKTTQYKDSANYEQRMKLLDYSDPKLNHWQWLAEQHDLSDATDILELGCGPGILWRYMDRQQFNTKQHLLLTDFSAGMLTTAHHNIAELHLPCKVKLAEADAESLVFQDNSFDAVLAHFMLYHLPSPGQGVQEIKRVMKTTGTAYISTFFAHSAQELLQVAHDLDARIPPYSISSPFSHIVAENILKQHFVEVEQKTVLTSLKITNANILVDYFKTYPTIQKLQLPESFFAACKERVEDIITAQGALESRFGMAFFRCAHKINNEGV